MSEKICLFPTSAICRIQAFFSLQIYFASVVHHATSIKFVLLFCLFVEIARWLLKRSTKLSLIFGGISIIFGIFFMLIAVYDGANTELTLKMFLGNGGVSFDPILNPSSPFLQAVEQSGYSPIIMTMMFGGLLAGAGIFILLSSSSAGTIFRGIQIKEGKNFSFRIFVFSFIIFVIFQLLSVTALQAGILDILPDNSDWFFSSMSGRIFLLLRLTIPLASIAILAFWSFIALRGIDIRMNQVTKHNSQQG